MKHHNRRFLLPFASGMVAALVAIALVGGGATLASTRYEDLSLFTMVLSLVRRNYVEPVDEHRLLRGALRGLVRELDPHSAFMDIDAYQEMQVDTKGEFHGLGIEITKRQGESVEVVSPIEGTPADRAGIKARDLIVSICPTERPEGWTEDCRPTKDMSLFQAVQLMRGERGTEITINIYRQGFDVPRPFTIKRDVVKVRSVSGRMLEPGIGYLRIRAFQERTVEEAREKLIEMGELTGLVIDLRGNPGGLLEQAVKVANEWLTEGLIVYTQGREESQRQDYVAGSARGDSDYPIVVLVNEGTASASEIVAGALQDHRRALVLGVATFGKGSVQTVYPLEDGSGLRLTTALYFTPAGRSIQEVGIVPDITVHPAPELARRHAAYPGVRERDLTGHFTHEEADPGVAEDGDPEAGSVGDEEPSAAPGDALGDSPPESDQQLTRAVEVLKSWTYFEQLGQGGEDFGGAAEALAEDVSDASGDSGEDAGQPESGGEE
jgi:carboxyl-terminal processing protease